MGTVYVYPFSDQNGTKTLPDGAAHTYITYLREYPPPPPAYVYKGGYRLYMEQVKFFCQHFVYKFIIPSLT